MTDPILADLYSEAVLQQAQADFKAGHITAADLSRIIVQGRDDKTAARQWFWALTGGRVGGKISPSSK